MKQRKIKQIVLHCTATKEGNHVTSDMVRAWHINRGFSDIGYHYLIYLDGTVVPCRNINEIGAGVKGFNSFTIHICYVGGLSLDMRPKDTRTEAQKKSLLKLIMDLKISYPMAFVCGHKDFPNVAKACPCFEASIVYRDFNTGSPYSVFRLPY